MFDGVLEQFGLTPDAFVDLIRVESEKVLSEQDFISLELNDWLHCHKRKLMLDGLKYYRYEVEPVNKHKLWGKDADGAPTYIDYKDRDYLDNQYANLVDQKVNYILGKPLLMQSENDNYTEWLNQVFDKKFRRMLVSATVSALNEGLVWLNPYYKEDGTLAFKYFPAHEILPVWRDDEHTEIEFAIRYYLTIEYEDRTKKYVPHVDIYKEDKIYQYLYDNGNLIENVMPFESGEYGTDAEGKSFSWGKIPLIPFKYNQQEIPLLQRVKLLQDSLNRVRTNWDRSMSEQVQDNILVLKNYGGESLNDFKDNLVKYGAVKVRDEGGVEVLNIPRESSSYTDYLNSVKKAITENGRGFDAKDDRMSSNPNEMNLRSMYSDIDLDSDMIEQQYQASFDQLLWFVDEYLKRAGAGDFSSEEVVITFDRNLIVNDADIINNIKMSQGLVSNETLLVHHPFVTDVEAEKAQLEQEQQENLAKMVEYQELAGTNTTEDEDNEPTE